MNDEAGFLAKILSEPEEDTHRLVYADWLEENGRPERAEFIRVQVELATFDSSYYLSYTNRDMCENSAVPLIKRSAELLHPAWSRDLIALPLSPTACNDWMFRRGFASEVISPAADWVAHGDLIRSRHPVTKVKLTTWVEYRFLADGRTQMIGRERDHWVPRGESFEHTRRGILTWLLKQEWPGVTFELPT